MGTPQFLRELFLLRNSRGKTANGKRNTPLILSKRGVGFRRQRAEFQSMNKPFYATRNFAASLTTQRKTELIPRKAELTQCKAELTPRKAELLSAKQSSCRAKLTPRKAELLSAKQR